MKKLAIIYHSGYGHTEYYAKKIAEGAQKVSSVSVTTLSTEQAMKDLESLSQYDGFIFGSPTYMGSVSAGFKTFMDATSGLWMKRQLQNKFAAGFTISGSPSGDKLQTLIQISIFAAQHGMFWVGQNILPETYSGVPFEQAANRLGSFLGAMAQAGQVAPEVAFNEGDLKTAHLFGERIAHVVSER